MADIETESSGRTDVDGSPAAGVHRPPIGICDGVSIPREAPADDD